MHVHNITSGTLGQWIRKEKKYMHFSIQTHTQNMGQDNNSPTEKVHNTTSETMPLDKKEKKYMHL